MMKGPMETGTEYDTPISHHPRGRHAGHSTQVPSRSATTTTLLMASPGTGDHDRVESASVGDDRTPICDALQRALDSEDPDTKHYHLREALQFLHIENNDEIVRLTRKALNAEATETADFLIREALELRRIETTVATARRTNPDERAR